MTNGYTDSINNLIVTSFFKETQSYTKEKSMLGQRKDKMTVVLQNHT